jgi:mono/diheme cytochrome c family protein
MSGSRAWVTASQQHHWARRWPRRLAALLLLTIALLGTATLLVGLAALVSLNRSTTPHYADAQAHFKYGSIGSEPASGLPAKLWHALPHLTPEAFGEAGDWRHFGWLYDDERPDDGPALPIGISSRVHRGIRLVWLNCASCHTGTVTDAPGRRRIIPGMPANNLDLYGFFEYILTLSTDARIGDIDQVQRAIEASGDDLGWIEKQLWRFVVLPQAREQLLQNASAVLPLLAAQSPWGPGRVDTFNPYKLLHLGGSVSDLDATEVHAASDFPSIFLQGPREGMQLHWDGNNRSLAERNLSAALGAGVTPETTDHAAIERVADWLEDLPPPAPALAAQHRPEQALLEQGRKVYAQACFACHGGRSDDVDRNGRYRAEPYDFGGEALGTVTPIDVIGTDRGRFDSYTEAFAANQRRFFAGTPYRFRHFEKTDGYANHPLDGLWLRAPYLHNGSVPTLADLLEPPAARPTAFLRGSDQPDRTKGGFEAPACDPRAPLAPEEGFCFDTALPGNSNGGHLWGTELPSADKAALLVYLLTF